MVSLKAIAEHQIRVESLEFANPETPFARRAEIEALLNEGFGVAPQHSFYEDFPVWDTNIKVEGRRTLIAESAGKIVAVTSVRVATLRINETTLPVALIGGVATHPEFRSMGIASKLVSLAMHWGMDEGAVFCFLWGSEIQFYKRLGFSLTGSQLRIPLRKVEGHSSFSNPNLIGRGYISKCFELRQKQSLGLSLRACDENWFKEHKNVDWFWSGSPKSPKAMIAVGKGIDLHNMVHESCGESEGVNDLFQFAQGVYQKKGESLFLLRSPGDGEVLRSYSSLEFAQRIEEPLALARVLNVEKAFGVWKSLQTHPSQLFLNQDHTGYSIFKSVKASIKQDRLEKFGPFQLNELTEFFLKSPGPFCSLPVWLWGLDSC